MSEPVRHALVYGDTPPSWNRTMHQHWRMQHRAKKNWQGIFEALLLESDVPRPSHRIMASAELRFPVRRGRDEGNYRTLIEKALGDALVNGGWLPDDTPEHFRFQAVTFDPMPGPNTTLVMLDVSVLTEIEDRG